MTARILLVLLLLLAGCARQPDTALHPSPTPAFAPLKHPFRGARLYVDPGSQASRWQAAHGAAWLAPITGRPQAIWLTGPGSLARLPWITPGTLPVLVAYDIPRRDCTGGQGARDAAAYLAWIGRLGHALGSVRAAIVLEPDAVAADCFTAERAALLRQAVHRLKAAGQYVYLDAGHSRWHPTGVMAERLLASGIQEAEGFAVNVANRQSTDDSYRWARELSDLVGGREFVIDTSRNGLGPPPGDAWCNPARQALGQPPTTDTHRPGLAALLWIKRPGESDGPCGGESSYGFSPRQARILLSQ